MNITSTTLSAFLLRLTLGIILFAHGALKLFVFTIPGTVGYFESLGFPAILAHLTIAGEIVGGLALILGIFPRLASLLSLPLLIGATSVHFGNDWVFSNEGGGWEFPALLVALALIVTLQGGGAFVIKRIPFFDRLTPNFLK